MKGSGWGMGWSPVVETGFRAFQRAKMSPQDTQINTINCIFFKDQKTLHYI